MSLLIDSLWLRTAESKGGPTAFTGSTTPQALSDSNYGKRVSEPSHSSTVRAHTQAEEATGPMGGAETSSAQPSSSQGKPLSTGQSLSSVVRDSLIWWVS